jgi:hypothetical protein
MEQNLAEQHSEIQKWLEDTLGGENVPEYEINSKTVNHLYTLMEESRAKKKTMEILLEDLERKTSEYESEST